MSKYGGWVLPRKMRETCHKKGHKFQVIVDAYFEYVIVCKRWGCQYTEIDPNGLRAKMYRSVQ